MQCRESKEKIINGKAKSNFIHALTQYNKIYSCILIQIERGCIQFNLEITSFKIEFLENVIVLIHNLGDLTIVLDDSLSIKQYGESTFELLYENKDCITIDFL